MDSSKIHIGRQHLIGSLKSLTAIDGGLQLPHRGSKFSYQTTISYPINCEEQTIISRQPWASHYPMSRGNKQLPADNHRSKAYNSNQLFRWWPEPLLAGSYPCDGPKFSCQTTISRSRHWRGSNRQLPADN